MSSSGYENDRFSQLTADFAIGFGITMLPKDGQRIPADAEAGQAFREQLLGAYAEWLDRRGLVERAGEFSAAETADLVSHMLQNIEDPDSIIAPEELVALNGAGFLLAQSALTGSVQPIELESTETLFGNLQAGAFSEYYALPEGVSLQGMTDEEMVAVEMEARWGLSVLLDKVVVCQAEGVGEPVKLFSLAAIPLGETELVLHKTYPPQH